jgi:hypothetical protein
VISIPEDAMNSIEISYKPKGLYIGGKWLAAAAGKSLITVNPANGEKLGEVPWADRGT